MLKQDRRELVDNLIWPSETILYLVVGFIESKRTEKAQAEEKKLGEDGFVDNGGNETKKQVATFKGKRIGIGYVDQVEVDKNGKLQFIRRDNGDQDHQGRHARISCGDNKILHIKLYEY